MSYRTKKISLNTSSNRSGRIAPRTRSSSQPSLQEWLSVESGGSRLITIVFTDIVGSTKLGREVGDEKWNEQVQRHRNRGSELLAKWHGYKINFIGDAFLAAFRTPVDAIDFATAFQESTGHESIKIRVCIHCGTVRVSDNDIIGSSVNYAARILKWKKDAGIVLSAAAHDALKYTYGAQRRKELFIMNNRVKLTDFAPRPLYSLNLDEWWGKAIRESVPDITEARSANCATGVCIRQATPEEIDWMADLEKRAYPEGVGVPSEILHAWHERNPNGFSVLCRADGELIGHLDILPLTPAGVELLLRGQETEQAITPEMLYSLNDQDLADAFYVESIVVKDKYKELKPRALFAILSSFESLVNRIGTWKRDKLVYGLGGTLKGERLMQQLGFRLIRSGDDRVDHYSLYEATLEDIQTNITSILKG